MIRGLTVNVKPQGLTLSVASLKKKKEGLIMINTILSRFAMMITMISALTSCAGSPMRTSWEAEENRENMIRLSIGQTKNEALAIMGKPYKTESYIVNGMNVDFCLYMIEGTHHGRPLTDDNFTPLAFENGKLSGWGRNYYDRVLRVKQDINIKTYLKIA